MSTEAGRFSAYAAGREPGETTDAPLKSFEKQAAGGLTSPASLPPMPPFRRDSCPDVTHGGV
jgi:hypothetical protein